MTRVSVVVPTRNRRAKLERLLTSIEDLREALPHEVIVVDGRSSDSTRDFLREWNGLAHPFSPVVLDQATKVGPGDARNLGMQAAGTDVVAFVDDDCIVDSNWLKFLIPPLDRSRRVVGAGGRVLPTRPDLISRYYAFYRILEPPPSLLYLVTANCAYTREEALAVGGFDGDIPTPGGEDVALSIRLREAGWSFEYAPGALVRHEFRSNLIDLMKTFRNYGRGCRQASDRIFSETARV
jgi:glycosyltransferase involved in cell wall biosynthesis